MKIYLIRHGLTEYNAQRRYQGRSDIPLSEAGKEALQNSGKIPDIVFVSPLRRARETASVLFPASEQFVLPDLTEMDFGIFEGRTADEMEADPVCGPAYRSWVNGMCTGRCPGGEDLAEFIERSVRGFLQAADQSHGKDNLYIVAHGGTQMALMKALGPEKEKYYEWQTPAGCGLVLDWNGSRLCPEGMEDFRKENHDSHVPQ